MRIYPRGTQCSEFGPEGWFRAGGDGRFVLPGLPDGKIELNVDAAGHAKRAVFVTLPAGPRNLSVETGAHWTGRVLDPDGAPVERCAITLRSKDGMEVTSTCDHDGAAGFDLPHIPAGQLKLRIRVATHPTLANRTFLDEVVVAPGEQRQVDISCRGPTIAGQVVTATGTPAAGAAVTTFSTDRDRAFWEGRFEVQADENGRFVFHHVAAGQWRVVAGSLVFGQARRLANRRRRGHQSQAGLAHAPIDVPAVG